ncbi:MAG: hypothetical protein ACI9HK_001681 [Pirellulaceae bacterium]|jgi:hypothetical protein
MPTTQKVASGPEIIALLTNLYGLDIQAAQNTTSGTGLVAIADYIDEDEEIRGFIGCDLNGSAILGAALTLIPMGSVEECLETGVLSDGIRENLAEVFNIAINLFSECKSRRLEIGEINFGDVAQQIAEEDFNDFEIVHFELTIARYGKGIFSIGTAPA